MSISQHHIIGRARDFNNPFNIVTYIKPSRIVTKAGPPDLTDGENEWYLIDTISNNFYKKENSVWSLIYNFSVGGPDPVGTVTDGLNEGGGPGEVFKDLSLDSTIMNFRTLMSDNPDLVITTSGDNIVFTLDGFSYSYNASNVGTGAGVFKELTNNNFIFKSLTTDINGGIVITNNADSIDISPIKNNYGASFSPNNTNDLSQGFSVGSFWNQLPNNIYFCKSNTVNNAIWQKYETLPTSIILAFKYISTFAINVNIPPINSLIAMNHHDGINFYKNISFIISDSAGLDIITPVFSGDYIIYYSIECYISPVNAGAETIFDFVLQDLSLPSTAVPNSGLQMVIPTNSGVRHNFSTQFVTPLVSSVGYSQAFFKRTIHDCNLFVTQCSVVIRKL